MSVAALIVVASLVAATTAVVQQREPLRAVAESVLVSKAEPPSPERRPIRPGWQDVEARAATPAPPSRFERARAERGDARNRRTQEFRERLEQGRLARARSAREFRRRLTAGREPAVEHGAWRKPTFEKRIGGGNG